MRLLSRFLALARVRGLAVAIVQTIHWTVYRLVRAFPSLRFLYFRLPLPVNQIEIETTTRCPLRCVFCEHTYWDEPGRDMSFEEFRRIMDRFPYLVWIGLTGIGESLVNKDYLDMLRLLKERLIYVEIFDPFLILDEGAARAIIETKVDRLMISFDAATKTTYEKIRVGAKFERVVENIRTFARLRDETGVPLPEVIFHFIIIRENLDEIVSYISFTRELMGDQPYSIQFTRMLHPFPEVEDLFTEVPKGLIEEAEEKARELGVPLHWNRDVPAEKAPISECLAWIQPFIFVDGTVVPCCAGNEANRRPLQRETSMGNILHEDWNTIWNGPAYRELRRKILAGETPKPCSRCPVFRVCPTDGNARPGPSSQADRAG